MTPEPAAPALDQLLAASSQVDPVAEVVLAAARARVFAAAEADIARAALVAKRRRRHRRIAGGLVAAGVVGILTSTVLSAGPHGTPRVPTADPRRSPSPIEPSFTTVAQVVAAAAAADVVADPTASRYWKVVTSFDCGGVPDSDGVDRPAGSTCRTTIWTGNGVRGVSQDANGGVLALPPGTVDVAGRTLTWRQANSQPLTDGQVASMVADSGGGKKDDRAPSGFYVFKNAIELLTDAPASPAIREQLWRQLGAVQGVVFNGRDADSLGRAGWRLTWSSPRWGSESIIVDTSSGLPLELSDQAPGVESPNVSTIVSAGPVDEAPDPGPGGPNFFPPR